LSATLDCIVIGAGVVGLATARSFSLAGRHYKEDPLNARLCVAGNKLLYRYCEDRHIPFQRIGKLNVASQEIERESLTAIHAQAARNGVHEL
jgi:L-2-hydroxyglutarate oxidase LhgO